jgi:hypothetical protein
MVLKGDVVSQWIVDPLARLGDAQRIALEPTNVWSAREIGPLRGEQHPSAGTCVTDLFPVWSRRVQVRLGVRLAILRFSITLFRYKSSF